MKNIGPANNILGRRIERKIFQQVVLVFREVYWIITWQIQARQCKKKLSLVAHFKLSTKQCPCISPIVSEAFCIFASPVRVFIVAYGPMRIQVAIFLTMSNPGRLHSEAVKWMLRYLQGNTNPKLFLSGSEPKLVAFTIANMVGDADSKKSISYYLITVKVSCRNVLHYLLLKLNSLQR